MRPIAIELTLIFAVITFIAGFLVGYHRGFYTGTIYKNNVENTRGYETTLPNRSPAESSSWWRSITYTTTSGNSTLLQVCPDEMIDNQMPTYDTQTTNRYYIVNGQRHEIAEFDGNWVSTNCTVKVQTVY